MTAHGLEIERLNSLYFGLSQINQAIVRKRTRDELFRSVCDVLVEHGAFALAWIGWQDRETNELVPVAHARNDLKQGESITAFLDREARGPAGMALRGNRPWICSDVLDDPAAPSWREDLEQQGLCASAVFPICSDGTVGGTLGVYANRRGLLGDKEMVLLGEAVADISLALDKLTREHAFARAEEIVKRFVAIVESTDDAIISKTIDGTVTSWNPAAQRMFGYTAEEMVGRSIEVLIPADRPGEERMILDRIRAGERIKQFETIRARKDGTLFPVSLTVSPIWRADKTAAGVPEIVGISKIARDISERKDAEAIAAREQRLAGGLIDAMPGIFYLYDDKGQFLRWNRNFERVSGYSAAEIAKMHPLDFFRSDEKALLQRKIAEVFETGEGNVEASLLSKDGRTTPYFFTGERLVLDGAPRLVGIGLDITERKTAEDAVRKSEERYRTTLDTILEGCQILAFDWRYLYLNPAAALQNRRPNAELLGRSMPDAWPGIEATPLFALLRRCMEDRVGVHAEVEFTFGDGSSGWFDVRAQPVAEGIFVLSIDTSERVHAENALRELNESLERKVVQRTLDLDAARERAEAADRIKSAFLATMSHELRTPLNSILGFTGIVLKGLAGTLNPEQSKQLGMVQGSARHLLDLINDVLDISKIEAGQLEVRCAPFDLRASVERVAASVLPLAEKRGLVLRITMPEVLESMESDRRRVEQILLNLFNNAIKFTDRGRVTLAVEIVSEDSCAGQDDTRRLARLRVTDTGVGIKEDDLSKLFQPFRQIDSGLQRQYEGTGLGLAICRRLTELLGGTICAESVWGEGSAFTVLLPMKRT
jgi:PAS domain S-box-containing protein